MLTNPAHCFPLPATAQLRLFVIETDEWPWVRPVNDPRDVTESTPRPYPDTAVRMSPARACLENTCNIASPVSWHMGTFISHADTRTPPTLTTHLE